ncbi:hypothetical protein CTAM01_14595 [Colletotrichum tamarilloi]|uniref:Uncharacterized protein n=1 Tax=Colletotrichum tamarilloi TaxID=1209934 RepID=A0ABQ9QP07_9PEZI|nr:uncharacterized protein CTAM01_14595 [Colletotrichum tamarilloi]KAK1479722.1 hypothetical protein CTAM01_14595 [Colletotrichum tamarilloi]
MTGGLTRRQQASVTRAWGMETGSAALQFPSAVSSNWDKGPRSRKLFPNKTRTVRSPLRDPQTPCLLSISWTWAWQKKWTARRRSSQLMLTLDAGRCIRAMWTRISGSSSAMFLNGLSQQYLATIKRHEIGYPLLQEPGYRLEAGAQCRRHINPSDIPSKQPAECVTFNQCSSGSRLSMAGSLRAQDYGNSIPVRECLPLLGTSLHFARFCQPSSPRLGEQT